ncbi:class I adenylate-forming enzyme family protein [Modestobacter sp. URMC 112]
MTPRTAVDDFRPEWESFAAFFLSRTDGDALFLVELDGERGARHQWSVTEWVDRVLATVDWLRGRGVEAGDVVATLAGNTADALALAYASWVLGACCAPLNPGDSEDRQVYILRDSSAALLVHRDGDRDLAEALRAATGVPLAATAELPAGTGTPSPDGRPGTGAGSSSDAGLEVPALRVYTSGTTGEPKGVVLTAANLLTDCDALAAGLDWAPGTRVITVLPVHHVNGLVVSSLVPWYARLSTVLCDRFRSERFWADVDAERADVCSVVPSLLEFLLHSAGTAPAHFREFVCGAGPLMVETVLESEQRLGVPVRHLYGLSETTAVVTLTPRLPDEERRRWHREYGFPSVGPALPHAEVAVLDDTGRPVGAGVRGELAVRGAVVMQGYAGQPEATREAFRDGWFHSGDEGFWQDGPGGRPFFFITGRMKELLIRGGVNLSPFEIDAVLVSHPAVRYALAIPFENRFYGEEVAAYVVPQAEVTEEEILAHCARYLDYARRPKVVVFGDDVPYTATGKAKRLELKKRLADRLSDYRDVQFRRSRTAGDGDTRPPPPPGR